MRALLSAPEPELSCLKSEGLVHHGGEVREGMQCKGKLDIGVESFPELLLPASIIGEIATCIAREVEEFPLIFLDSFTALSEVAELGLLAVHYCLRDVTSAKSRLEFSPGEDGSFSMRALVGVPPLCSGAYEEVSREGDIVQSIHASRLQLAIDITEPIIGFQVLLRVMEGRGAEPHEALQVNTMLMVLIVVLVLVLELELINDSLHEHLILVKLLHHRGHIVRRRRWFVSTTTTTSRSNHPAKI